MKRTLTSILLGLCLASVTQAAVPSVEDQIKIFQEKAAAAVEKRTQQAGSEQRSNNYALYSGSALAQLMLRWQNNPTSQDFEQAVAQAVSVTGNDPEVLKAANDLLTAVKKDREDRITAFRTELKTMLEKVGAACLSAKSPADLDKALEMLAPYRESNYGNQRQIDQAAWQRGANAQRFVMRWQDYLVELTARRENRSDRITSILNDLANMADPELMPRSRILALIPASPGSTNSSNPGTQADPAAEISAIIGKLESPDHIGDAVEKLKKLRGNSYNQPVDEALSILNNLVELQSKVKEGEISPGLFSENNRSNSASPRLSAENRETIAQIRRTLLLSAAGVYLKSSGITPKTGESLESYTHRVAGQAAKQDDWQLVRSALEVYRSSISNTATPQWLTSDIEMIATYISARNQELAGQHAQAIASYQRVLRGSGKYIPAKSIGERLAALKKSQPEAFEEAARIPEPYNPYQRYNQPQPMPLPQSVSQSRSAPNGVPISSPPAPAPAPAPSQAPASVPPVAPAALSTPSAPAVTKEAPPATAALIKRNLRQLQAAADQYCLEHGVKEVASSKLYGPEKDKYIRELKPVAGEDYSTLLMKEGGPVSVNTSDGATVTFEQ